MLASLILLLFSFFPLVLLLVLVYTREKYFILMMLSVNLSLIAFQMGQSLQWQLGANFLAGVFGILMWMGVNLTVHVAFILVNLQTRLTKIRDIFISSSNLESRLIFSVVTLLISYLICFFFKSILVQLPPFLTVAYIIYLCELKYSNITSRKEEEAAKKLGGGTEEGIRRTGGGKDDLAKKTGGGQEEDRRRVGGGWEEGGRRGGGGWEDGGRRVGGGLEDGGRRDEVGIIRKLLTPVWLSLSVMFSIFLIVMSLIPCSNIAIWIAMMFQRIDLTCHPPDFSFLALMLGGGVVNYLLPFYMFLQFNRNLLVAMNKPKDFSYKMLYLKFKYEMHECQEMQEPVKGGRKEERGGGRREGERRREEGGRRDEVGKEEGGRREEVGKGARKEEGEEGGGRRAKTIFFWVGVAMHVVWVFVGFWTRSYLFTFFSIFGLEYFIEAGKGGRGVYQIVSFGVLNAIFFMGRMEDEVAQKVDLIWGSL